MNYATEYIASTLKAARENKGLSQRELSAKSGVPQGHISKIENGAVDLRVSSLIALARILELELTLVPRKAVPAVKSIARSSARSTHGKSGQDLRLAHQELTRLQLTIGSLPKIALSTREVAQLQRQVRELQHFPLSRPDLEAIRTINQTLKAFRNNAGNLSAIRQSLSQIQSLRNALAHSSVNVPRIESVRPAYSLDEDDHG
ncbi:MAG: helix-turn-helix domain-containing protein [Sphingomonadales bacterium]